MQATRMPEHNGCTVLGMAWLVPGKSSSCGSRALLTLAALLSSPLAVGPQLLQSGTCRYKGSHSVRVLRTSIKVALVMHKQLSATQG